MTASFFNRKPTGSPATFTMTLEAYEQGRKDKP